MSVMAKVLGIEMVLLFIYGVVISFLDIAEYQEMLASIIYWTV